MNYGLQLACLLPVNKASEINKNIPANFCSLWVQPKLF